MTQTVYGEGVGAAASCSRSSVEPGFREASGIPRAATLTGGNRDDAAPLVPLHPGCGIDHDNGLGTPRLIAERAFVCLHWFTVCESAGSATAFTEPSSPLGAHSSAGDA
ncbi:hypothetical protein [Streptomyces sp. NPDC058457]|uniref:hypothetical protein n=1 Tax=Streptomyces sp. NPDC058457 TaxID=3346507 RepID=UPI00365E7C9E